ncbi:MAG TPA: Gfo/Idh/MocA family oxidoreductase [Anaerolineae bacterium]
MSTRILRWGLLGTANINRVIIAALGSSARNRLTAVASRDGERGRAYAAKWQIPQSFGSYESLLADPDIDVVYISLPNRLHAEWTVKAAQAGKHVLCEKPLAVTVEEVDAIAAAAKAAGVVVAEALMYRHDPLTLKVKEIVDSGALGQLRLVRGAYTFDISKRPTDIRLRGDLFGGSVRDVGIYPISYTRYILGAEPSEVFGWQIVGAGGVDEVFAGQMRFPGDIFAQFDCGFRVPQRNHIEISGSTGELTVPSPFKPGLHEQIFLARGDQVETIDVAGQQLYLGEVEDLADAILEGKPQRIPLSWSRDNVATLCDLLRSAATGQPVKTQRS